MRVVAIVVLLIAIVIGGSAAYRKHLAGQEVAQVSVLMRDASTRLESQIDYMRAPRGVKFREVISDAETHLKIVDAALMSLQNNTAPRNPALVSHAIEYLKVVQESLRGSRAVFEAWAERRAAVLALENTAETLSDFVADPKDPANKFRADVAGYQTTPVIRRADKAETTLSAAAKSFGQSLSALVSVKDRRPAVLSEEIYVPADKLKDITFRL